MLNKCWYQRHPLRWLLWPFSLFYLIIIKLRRFFYQRGWFTVKKFPVPVIIVGNLTVGGTGKTPLVIYLVEQLQKQGFSPGIVSRGYRSRATHYPLAVNAESATDIAGDEAVLLAQRTQVPVVISPNRPEAVAYLLKHNDCNVIISDDGLQHYALARDVEVVVIDEQRGLGNGLCLPAGPLREPKQRLEEVDIIVYNQMNDTPALNSDKNFAMHLQPGKFINLKNPHKQCQAEAFTQSVIHAIAGIGNPERFFKTLGQLGLKFTAHPFSDHYTYTKQDLLFTNSEVVLMTEKDAVKCRKFAQDHWWYLEVNSHCDPMLQKAVRFYLGQKKRRQ